MNAKKLPGILALLLILALGFSLRAATYFLPALSEVAKPSFQDEEGEPYLTEMDSYFYVRLAREMAESGGPFLYNLRAEDPLMTGSAGPIPVFLSILCYYLWRLICLFSPVSVVQVARWMGPVLGSLAAVPAFVYVKRRAGLMGGVVAGLLAALAVPFVSHTHAGFFDTDMLLGVLPLGFILLEISAMQEERLSRQALLGALSGGLLALLSLTWFAFYTYFWLMVLGGLAGSLLALVWPARYSFKRRWRVVRGWLLSVAWALALVFLVRGRQGIEALTGVLSIFGSVSGSSNSFPFTHQFTGEMQGIANLPNVAFQGVFSLLEASGDTVLGCLGGLLPCLMGALALPLGLALCAGKDLERAERHDRIIARLTEMGMLGLWLAVGVKLAGPSRRFAEIAVLPLCALAGLGAGYVCLLFRRWKPAGRRLAGAALALVVCLPTALGAWRVSAYSVPSATDPLNEAMAFIRETQDEDAVIAAWWDDGYFMQYAARRRTIADGGSSSSAAYCLLARALLAEDPARMAGILRMAENSGNSAIWHLTGLGASEAEAMEVLMDIAPLKREAAKKRAMAALPLTEEEAEALMDMTHPLEERPLLLTLQGSVLEKIEAIAYYGYWSLEEGRQTREAYWLGGMNSFEMPADGETTVQMRDPAIFLTVRRDGEGRVEVSQQKNGKEYRLSRLSVWREGELVQDDALPGDGPVVILVEENGRVCAFSCSPSLADSMLVRLYVCGDKNMPGVRLLGDWYGELGGDGCPAQSRIRPMAVSNWCAQVWRVSESPGDYERQ